MTMRATATLGIKSWEEAPSTIEGGPNLVRASVRQTYEGEIAGEGTLEYLMIHQANGFVPTPALERVVARIGDRSGSFVIRHTGSYADNAARSTFEIVPGNATGDLQGITGSAPCTGPTNNPAPSPSTTTFA
ncbi:MAG: DUF3224 domain-containing protein [Thermomicrobiales bacterium]